METGGNVPNFYVGGGNEERVPEDRFGSLSQIRLNNQNSGQESRRSESGANTEEILQHLMRNLEANQGAAQTQPIQSDNRETQMENFHVSGGGEDGETRQSTDGSSNIGLTTSQRNFTGSNQAAAENEPSQNTATAAAAAAAAAPGAAEKEKKRLINKNYRERKKNDQEEKRRKLETVEKKCEELTSENEILKRENEILQLRLEMKTQEADDNRKRGDEWKEMYKKDQDSQIEQKSISKTMLDKIASIQEQYTRLLELQEHSQKLQKTMENQISEIVSDARGLQPSQDRTFASEMASTTPGPVN